MIETRVHVTYLYPGSFLPEEGKTYRLKNDADITAQVLALSADENWFAAEVVYRNFKRWTDDEGNESWRADGAPLRKHRIYIGHALQRLELEARNEGGRYDALLSNTESNRWGSVILTRRGNWQPFQDGDVCLSPAEVTR